MNFEPNPVITEDERQLLAGIETAVESLVKKGWRVATDEVSERRFISSGDTLYSLKLELRKGPLMMDGC